METHQLLRGIRKEIGTKRLAKALGVTLSTLYRWCRDPVAGTGRRNPLDVVEMVVVLLTGRRDGRPHLHQLDLWWRRMMRDALDSYSGTQVTAAELREKSIHALREMADVLDACHRPGSEVEPERVIREALEAREWLDRIIDAAEAGVIDAGGGQPQTSTIRRVS